MSTPSSASRSTSDGPPPRRYDGSGRRADAEERRRRVVEVARRLFLEQGYGSTSIAEIAREAGVSGPLVYAAFDSKAGILSRVADVAVAGSDDDDGLIREREEFARIFDPDLSPRERIEAGMRGARKVHERSADVLQLVDSVAGTDASVQALSEKLHAGAYEDGLMFTRMLQAAGVRPDVPEDELATAIVTLTDARAYARLVHERGWTPDRFETWAITTLCWMLLDES
ncbi:TetR/AcrR family transcriptional regulator [Dermatobacter hominis]|uniref:TetR/AcrR family transcriptional regulator n=1 Tax=Dermatobacter hominis TaxID=2884263 RepID=UPI001D117D42|nr:TetR/AcrR family transcriptional regulator [Dermatobacter hominis]UDY36732.1 TetR/AcrR family transcriptional regulator; helix-turn-helix transcriptional regulator [Dermatobacter hominis]